jgi:hypothetical protein
VTEIERQQLRLAAASASDIAGAKRPTVVGSSPSFSD